MYIYSPQRECTAYCICAEMHTVCAELHYGQGTVLSFAAEVHKL